MKNLNLETVSKALSYNPETGVFTRIGDFSESPRRTRRDLLGTEADTFTVRGYVDISIGNRRYAAHRLAFLFMTGSMPEFVDHRDGDGTNNKWSNLRACTKSQNMANRGASIKSTSGIKGVYPHKPSGRWRAQIVVNHRIIHLGYFKEKDKAAEAYNSAAVFYFGEFARV